MQDAKQTKTGIVKNIEMTLRKEFHGLKFPKELVLEIESVIKEEPPTGYQINDVVDIIGKIAHIRNVKSHEVIREIYYMMVGNYFVTKYSKPICQKISK